MNPHKDTDHHRSSAAHGILFICTGNICRSPTAEAVLAHMLDRDRQLSPLVRDGRIVIDSAGISNYHEGEVVDQRSMDVAARSGYDMSPLRSRMFRPDDFDRFSDLIAMGGDHLTHMQSMSRAMSRAISRDTHRSLPQRVRMRLFMDFPGGSGGDVPDPYYGGSQGFDQVLAMIEDGCGAIVRELRARFIPTD